MKTFRWVAVFSATFAVILLIYGIVLVLGLIPQPEHVQELEGTSLGAVRDVPNWAVGIFAILAGISGLGMASLPVLMTSAERGARRAAWDISKKLWYVQGVFFGEMGGVLRLSSVGQPPEDILLPFRPAHPDIKQLRPLSRLSHVRFNYVGEISGDWGLESEVTTYLRLKEVGHL
jgi:hypothetical protein